MMRWPDTLKKPQTVVFRRVVYRLMGAKTYYLAQYADMAARKGAKGLHVAVWEAANKMKVPAGLVCHHKDGNPFNNLPDNLEVITHKQHRKHHPVRDMVAHNKHLDRVRPMTKVWHASQKGKEWHRQHGVNVWKDVPYVETVCRWCGERCRTRRPAQRIYCNNLCGFKARKWLGDFDKKMSCVGCGVIFVAKPSDGSFKYPVRCGVVCKRRGPVRPFFLPAKSPLRNKTSSGTQQTS